MIVAELIAELQKLPPDSRVVVEGYERGFDDIGPPRRIDLLVDAQSADHFCYGQHDQASGAEEDRIAAILISKPRPRLMVLPDE